MVFRLAYKAVTKQSGCIMENHYRLLISCPDTVGIVAAVSQFVAENDGWLSEASYYSDADCGHFFMRSEIKVSSLNMSKEEFCQGFSQIAEKFQMTWTMNESIRRKRVVILASLASHCLADLLHRWHSDDMYCDIVAVISNHDKLEEMAQWYNVPFHQVDMSNKPQGNQQIDELLEQYDAEVVVLARYMQIIPVDLCKKYRGRMINIHHSFLPSFIGANPYQRAYDRGVKLIGATAHYVTENLDEGPILEQDVIRVSHRHDKEDMVRLGKDVENRVLARGVGLHLEDRVIVYGNKTIILE